MQTTQTTNDIECTIKEIFLAHLLTGELRINKAKLHKEHIFIYYKDTKLFRVEMPDYNSNALCILSYWLIENIRVTCETKNDLVKHLNFINDNIEQIKQIKNNFLQRGI